MPSATGLTERAIKGDFYQALNAGMTGGWWNKLFMHNSLSDQDAEEYRFLGMVPAPREWKGELAKKTLQTFRISIPNKTWEVSLRFRSEDFARDKTGQIAQRASELGMSFQRHISSLLVDRITNGTGSTDGLAYDGQYFFDSDHSSGSSGTQLNLLTSTQVASLDPVAAAAPTQTEAATAVLNCIAYAQGILDDQGQPINEDASEWAVMCPVHYGGTFQAALYNATTIGASGAITSNMLASARDANDGALKLRLITTPRITGNIFYLFRLDGTTKPFIFQSVESPSIKVLGIGSEYETENNEVLIRAKAIYNIGYGQWEHAFKCTFLAD